MLSESRLSYLLQNVSRTFALTIPVLPNLLSQQVGISYLLCRACDTIEDDPKLLSTDKISLMSQFIDVLFKRIDCHIWVNELVNKLTFLNSYEKEVFLDLADIIETLYSYTPEIRSVILKGVWIMSDGMSKYQKVTCIETQNDLDHYCYSVAGVVGELLSNLFSINSNYSHDIKNKLSILSVSFGEGLQLTNICKDIWDDASRGVCWLPIGIKTNITDHDTVSQQLMSLSNIEKIDFIKKQVSITQGHLWNAVRFILTLPKSSYGIRRFCFICVAMAFMTVRNIYKRPTFLNSKEIKINRSEVKSVLVKSFFYPLSNYLLNRFFRNLSSSIDVEEINYDSLYNEVSLWNNLKFMKADKEK